LDSRQLLRHRLLDFLINATNLFYQCRDRNEAAMLLIDWHVQTIPLSRFNVFITPQKQQISHTYKNTFKKSARVKYSIKSSNRLHQSFKKT